MQNTTFGKGMRMLDWGSVRFRAAGGYCLSFLPHSKHVDKTGRRIEIVIGGRLSDGLLDSQLWVGETRMGCGTAYGGFIVFTGISALLRRFSCVDTMAG